MTILDTFYSIFKADTGQLEKGVEESDKKVKGLLASIAETDVAGAKLGETLVSLAGKAAALLGVTLSAKELWGTVSEVAAENFQLGKLAARFNTTAEAVDEFIDSGKLLGISTETTVESLTSLDRAIQDTNLGMGRAKKVFEELGIEVTDSAGKIKPVTEVLEELQAKMKPLDQGTKIRIMERLGLDPALLKLFTADMGELQKRLADIDRATGFNLTTAVKRSQEFTKAMKELGIETHSLTMLFEKMRSAFAIDQLSWVTQGIKVLTGWMHTLFKFILDNQQLVKGALIAISTAITAWLLPAAIRGAIAVGLMVAPFLLVGLAIAAVIALFALAYDEITNYMAGNDSLIGQIFEKYPKVKELVFEVIEAFKKVGAVLAEVFKIWVIAWEETWDTFKQVADTVKGWITTFIDFLIGKIDAFLAKFGGIKSVLGNVAEFAAKVGGSVFNGGQGFSPAGLVGDASNKGATYSNNAAGVKRALEDNRPVGVKGAIAAGKEQLGVAATTPLATQSSTSITNSIAGPKTSTKETNVKIDNVNVHTQATDAAGISKSIGDSLGAQMRQAASGADDGIAA